MDIYEGKNIKVGSMFVIMPTAGYGVIQGESIYIAHSDGQFYGVGDMQGAIWIQFLENAPHENAELFMKGVEVVDKYAPDAKRERCFKALNWLANEEWKTGTKYCQILNFFWELGAGHDFNTTYHKYRNYMN